MKTIEGRLPRLILFLSVIALWVSMYISLKISDRNYGRASTSVIALKPENVSEIQMFNNHEPGKELLAVYKSSSPKGNKVIYEFVHAINHAEPFDISPRQLILSHEVYLIVNRQDGGRPIKLELNLDTNCSETVYISILKVEGIFEATSVIGGAKAENYLLEWLQGLGFNDLGCKGIIQSFQHEQPNTACTRRVGVAAFSGSLRGLRLVPAK